MIQIIKWEYQLATGNLNPQAIRKVTATCVRKLKTEDMKDTNEGSDN